MSKQATWEEYCQWCKVRGSQPSRTDYMTLTFSQKQKIKDQINSLKGGE